MSRQPFGVQRPLRRSAVFSNGPGDEFKPYDLLLQYSVYNIRRRSKSKSIDLLCLLI